jgi:hypothetical protein
MDDLLANPGVQAAVVPFVVALVVASVLRPFGWFWSGLALLAAFLSTVYLTMGLQLEPLNSTRKIIVLGMAMTALAALREMLPNIRIPLSIALGVAAAGGLVWVLWPVLSRKTGDELVLATAYAVAYSGWLVAASDGLRFRRLRASSLIIVLAAGTALACFYGASASYAQLAGSLAAAGGAFLVLTIFKQDISHGATLVIPAVFLAAIIGYAATVYASLSWHALPFLAALPLLARIPVPRDWPAWAQAGLLVVYGIPAAAGAVYFAAASSVSAMGY